jgi:hypothetical protein
MQYRSNPSRELKMKANVYDEGQASAVSKPNKLEKPAPQKAKASARTGSVERC